MPTVLVTGASRGIGRTTALRLAAAGWDVLAGVRRAEDGEALLADAPAGRLTPILLDVADDAQIAALDDLLPPTLDAVVNNAGIVVPGPLEAVSSADLRTQFEVNVVGAAAVTRAVLPRIRAARGRIVFVSSVSGRLSTPMTGAYNASKFALEGLADAWRVELRPWGIRVSLVEPAMTDTDLWRLADETNDAAEAALSPAHRELYAAHIAGFRKTIPLMQRMAKPVDGAAAAIERALTARRPRARYVVGRDAHAQAVLGELTPTPLRDALFARATGVPRRR